MNNNLKNALITEVEEEINYIQNKLKEKDYINKNEIVFLNKVLDKYNDELLLTDIDIEFFIIFVLYFYNKEKSFDDLFCEIKDLKMDYSNFIPSMVEILEDLSVLFENGIYQKYLKPLKEEPSTKEKEKILEEINKEYDENYSKEFYNYFVNFEDIFDNFIEMQKFIEYLNVDENIVLLFAYYAQELGIKLAGFGYSIKDCLITVVSGNEIKEEKTLFQIKKEYGVDVFISQTSKRLSELEKSERKYYNQLNKSLEDYNKILSLINSEKIITLDKKLNISESILYLLNEYIFKHNLRIYESINGKEIHEIEKLFLSYKLNINKINEKDYEKIKNSKNNNLDRKLYYLTQKEFDWLRIDDKNYVQILLNTNEEILKFIYNLIRNEYISKSFIEENKGILISNNILVNEFDLTPSYTNFINNYNLLEKLNCDLLNISKTNKELLIIDNKDLFINYNICKEYDISFNNFNSSDYDLLILNNIKYFDYVDEFIELGLFDFIKDNPQVLNENTPLVLTRITIYKNIGLNFFNLNGNLISSILTGKNFYISNADLYKFKLNKINEYEKNIYFDILNKVKRDKIESNDISQILDDKFYKNDYEYIINGIIVSRKKVLRNIKALTDNLYNYSIEDVLYYSILHNMTLDLEQKEMIKIEINKCFKKIVK